MNSIRISSHFVMELVRRDIQSRYMGTLLGFFWATVAPVVTVLIFWFVFQVGFKSLPVDNVSFSVWLTVGIVPWFYIVDALQGGTRSITSSSYLVQKMTVSTLAIPVSKVISPMVVHLIFVLLAIILCVFYEIYPRRYWLQSIYYFIAMSVIVLGIVMVTSALVVFIKDVEQIVAMTVQFGFWLTPIFWSVSFLPEDYRFFIELNPFHYIVQGYRDSFLGEVWFWQRPKLTLYFWGVSAVFLSGGYFIFSRLEPHFTEDL